MPKTKDMDGMKEIKLLVGKLVVPKIMERPDWRTHAVPPADMFHLIRNAVIDVFADDTSELVINSVTWHILETTSWSISET